MGGAVTAGQDAVECRAALDVAPANTAVRLNLGIALYKSARYTDAVKEFGAVRDAAPDNLQARYLEADCRLRLGEPAAVITLLAPLESQRPDDLALAYMLGLAYLQNKQQAEGQRLVDRIQSREQRRQLSLRPSRMLDDASASFVRGHRVPHRIDVRAGDDDDLRNTAGQQGPDDARCYGFSRCSDT